MYRRTERGTRKCEPVHYKQGNKATSKQESNVQSAACQEGSTREQENELVLYKRRKKQENDVYTGSTERNNKEITGMTLTNKQARNKHGWYIEGMA